MGKPKISDEAKAFIVHSLACFDAPSVVAKALTAAHGVTITRQSIESYDPTKKAGRGLSPKWRAMFEETRKTFLGDLVNIAISHRAVRLRAIQRIADRAEEMGNLVPAAAMLEQAAKEVGEVFTNKHKVDHSTPAGLIAAPTIIQIVPVSSPWQKTIEG